MYLHQISIKLIENPLLKENSLHSVCKNRNGLQLKIQRRREDQAHFLMKLVQEAKIKCIKMNKSHITYLKMEIYRHRLLKWWWRRRTDLNLLLKIKSIDLAQVHTISHQLFKRDFNESLNKDQNKSEGEFLWIPLKHIRSFHWELI